MITHTGTGSERIMNSRYRSVVLAIKHASLIFLLLLLPAIRAEAADTPFPEDLTWTTPSGDSHGSMPLGNGDIGLNVWVEKSGDLLFYISKTDAWSDNVGGNKGLLKLGRVRVRLDPNPFAEGQPFWPGVEAL